MKTFRTAFTLIEVLIVIAIIGVLLGLLLGAIQKVRTVASGLEDKNKLKQILLATHQFASAFGGKLAGAIGETMDGTEELNPHVALLPYLSSGPPPHYKIINYGMHFDPVDSFLSKNDPSFALEAKGLVSFNLGKVSFAYSAPAFSFNPKLPSSFSDGTSQTIAFAEHYAVTGNRNNILTLMTMIAPKHLKPSRDGTRNGSFCDPAWEDWGTDLPTQIINQNSTEHPIQVTPIRGVADGRKLQALQSSGLKVGMMDGSVRVFNPTIAPEVLWAYITPRGGDIPND